MQLVAFERHDRSDDRSPGRHEKGSMGAAALGFEMLEAVRHGSRRIGAILPVGEHAGAVVDLNRALAVKLAAEDAGAPECEADSLLPSDPLAFLQRLPLSLEAASAALAFASEALARFDAPDLLGAGIAMARREVRLAAPVQRPGKLIGVAPPSDPSRPPGLFLKAPSAIAGPEDEIRLPAGGMPLGFHGELALVIGRRLRNATPDEALAAVAGYCVAISAHPFAEGAVTSTVGWSGDGFAPIGPALVTADEIPNPHDLRLQTRLSGESVQSAHTKELPLRLPELIAELSLSMSLAPGDVVLSGAPLGGRSRKAPRPLRDGDVIEVEVERVGRLAVYVRAGA
jgi:2-keto-4-pentenoate hydratase/2-oxohepta-3-ene-1,7-dioic acid hydratase in catechol pathway